MLVIFRNRIWARFTLDEKGALYESGKLIKKAAYVSIGLGILSVNPLLLGAGMIGKVRSAQGMGWRDVKRISASPRWQVVTLFNSWRPVLRLYCPTQEIYEEALAITKQKFTTQLR